MNDKTEKQLQKNNRIKIILVAVIFLVPVVIATLLRLTNWQPTETGNYGELIQPARPLTALEFKTANKNIVKISDTQQVWLMVTFGVGQCDEACQQNIYKMRQVHVATGKHSHRVKRLLVLTKKPDANLRETLKAYPQMDVAIGPKKAVRSLAKQMKTTDGTALDGVNRIYLIDPLGNFMMTYDKDADPRGIRKDMGRLLRASRIG